MPLSKVEESEKTAKLLPKESLHTLGVLELKVQKLKRERLYPTLVGTLYPRIVLDELLYIDELLRIKENE